MLLSVRSLVVPQALDNEANLEEPPHGSSKDTVVADRWKKQKAKVVGGAIREH